MRFGKMKMHFGLVAAATLLLAMSCGNQNKDKAKGGAGGNAVKPAPGAVKVELYVMSMCPFGVRALNAMIPAVKKLGNMVDFHVDYIVTPQGDNFKSLHGPNEVTGDIAQLCAKKLAPGKYLDFILCQNKSPRQVHTNWNQCAAKTGIDKGALEKCIKGPEGKTLLKESAARAKARNARGSPTIYVAGKRYSGGRTEGDFMRGICKAMSNNKPKACSNIPKPVEVNIIVLNDKRCKDRACLRANGIVRSMQRLFPGAKIKKLDYSQPEGKKLFAEAKLKVLPAVLFDSSVEKASGYARIKRWLRPAGQYKNLRIGAKFDPNAEICDNGKDDTGNGKVDCDDPSCKENMVCRKEEPKRLDLFVMSHCPFGIKALNAMKDVLDNFKGELDFHIHYIGRKKPDGTLSSMHGAKEVEEDKRELCAMKYYPKNHKYMEYILCRNKNIRSNDWKSCAKNGIDAAKIEKCANGEEGKKLLAESMEFSKKLGFGASPTWLANNRFKFSALDAESVRRNICQHNKGMKNCDKKLNSKVKGPKGSCGH